MSAFRPISEKSRILKYALQAAFLIWLVVVNVLYYDQFKQLFLDRIAPLVRR